MAQGGALRPSGYFGGDDCFDLGRGGDSRFAYGGLRGRWIVPSHGGFGGADTRAI
jgi:hypothetical protein